jgi:hypothetical protein
MLLVGLPLRGGGVAALCDPKVVGWLRCVVGLGGDIVKNCWPVLRKAFL